MTILLPSAISPRDIPFVRMRNIADVEKGLEIAIMAMIAAGIYSKANTISLISIHIADALDIFDLFLYSGWNIVFLSILLPLFALTMENPKS